MFWLKFQSILADYLSDGIFIEKKREKQKILRSNVKI